MGQSFFSSPSLTLSEIGFAPSFIRFCIFHHLHLSTENIVTLALIHEILKQVSPSHQTFRSSPPHPALSSSSSYPALHHTQLSISLNHIQLFITPSSQSFLITPSSPSHPTLSSSPSHSPSFTPSS